MTNYQQSNGGVASQNGDANRQLLIRIVKFGCFSIAAIAIAFFATRFGLVSPLEAILFCGLLLFAVLVLQRQSDLEHELHDLKQQVLNLDAARDLEQREQQDENRQIQNTLSVSTQEHRLQLARMRADISALSENRSASGSTSPATAHQKSGIQVSESGMPIATTDPLKKAATSSKNNLDLLKKNLKDAITGDSLNMHLQPVVEFESKQPTYFDAFMRLASGPKEYVDQQHFVRLAEEGGLMPAIDRKVIISSVRMLKTLSTQKRKAGVICPISPKSLSSKRDFAEVFGFLQSNSVFKNSLYIEMRQRDFTGLKSVERQRISEILALGFNLCLSHTLDLNLDPAKLAENGIKLLKVPASILIHADVDEDTSSLLPTDIAAKLLEFGISLIATEVQRESDVMALIDFNIVLGQGELFAPPRPVRAELLRSNEGVTVSKPRRIRKGAA